MTVEVQVSLTAYQPRAVMAEIITGDGRSTSRTELLPGAPPRAFILHSGASLRVEEGRTVPQPPPPAQPDPDAALAKVEE